MSNWTPNRRQVTWHHSRHHCFALMTQPWSLFTFAQLHHWIQDPVSFIARVGSSPLPVLNHPVLNHPVLNHPVLN